MADEQPNRRKHKTRDKPPLTAQEIRFAQRLLIGDTQRQAFLAAGFPPRVSDHATDEAASCLLRKPEVRAFLRHLQHVAAEAAKLTAEQIGVLVANIATVDFRRLMAPNGSFLPVDQWPADVAATLGGIETEDLFRPAPGQRGRKELVGHVRKVKVTSAKVAALRLLMEWKGMIGPRAADSSESAKPDPLVVGGEAKPDALGRSDAPD